MPQTPLNMLPGVNAEKSKTLNEAGFSSSQLIRFFQKMAQKLGGWSRLSSTALIGTCRGLFAWASLNGDGYIAAGTEQRLEVWNEGAIYDITPIYATNNLGYPAPFSTYSGQATIIVYDPNTSPSSGDWVNIASDVAIGGIVLQGLYQVQSVIDGTHYTITAASAATSHVIAGGVTSQFHTYNGQSTIVVTLANHGYTATTSIYTVYVSTTIAGITLSGPYIVQSVLNSSTFTISQVVAANSTTIGYENGGYVRIQYLLQTGAVSSTPAMGWGEGGYGLGPYGIGASSNIGTQLRQWTFGQFGQILIACPIGGSIYEWNPASGFFENQAVILSGAPAIATGIFVAMAQQQIIAYGIIDPNTMAQDPMLIGWCDVANFNSWTATATNQAGTFRLSRGSRIVGALQGPQYAMHWTDLGVWLQQYIGFPLVYGFNEIAQGCGLISMRSAGVLGGVVYWCSINQFYLFNGAAVSPLSCAVWDFFFQNANFSEQDKFLLAPNSHFNEFFYFFVSLSGSGEIDSYIKFNQVDSAWDYGTLIRTAWFDQNDVLSNNPIGVDGNALIQQHENTNDADGSPMTSSITTGFFKLAEGLVIIFLERMIPDFVATTGASIQITVNMVNYPDDTPLFSKTFTWIAGTTEYIIVRGRGRFAQISMSSSDSGSFWRLGEFLWIGTGSGRRP
jgi:hypothetical protein